MGGPQGRGDVPRGAGRGGGLVDRSVAAAIGGHAPSTVLQLAEARIIAADPEAHAMRREVERHRRYAALSRSDEFGYRRLIARITAGDAAYLDAMLERVADILTATHGHDHNRDELRSLALGWLARPADLLQLLLEHTQFDDDGPEDLDAPPDSSRSVRCGRRSNLDRLLGRLASMSCRQLAALRGKGTVFVHVDAAALAGQAGVARVEGMGPMLVQSLAELLGHPTSPCNRSSTCKQIRADAYEHGTTLKDTVWLLTGGDVFPFTPRTATRDGVDFDHVKAYDRDGPPGQTGTHNSGPLRRRHHRWKTHGGYRCRQAGPGRHLWQTPHGLCFLVDHTGTHPLDPDRAEVILTAPPGSTSTSPTYTSSSPTSRARSSSTLRLPVLKPPGDEDVARLGQSYAVVGDRHHAGVTDPAERLLDAGAHVAAHVVRRWPLRLEHPVRVEVHELCPRHEGPVSDVRRHQRLDRDVKQGAARFESFEEAQQHPDAEGQPSLVIVQLGLHPDDPARHEVDHSPGARAPPQPVQRLAIGSAAPRPELASVSIQAERPTRATPGSDSSG